MNLYKHMEIQITKGTRFQGVTDIIHADRLKQSLTIQNVSGLQHKTFSILLYSPSEKIMCII
jgi:hypothetical protein